MKDDGWGLEEFLCKLITSSEATAVSPSNGKPVSSYRGRSPAYIVGP